MLIQTRTETSFEIRGDIQTASEEILIDISIFFHQLFQATAYSNESFSSRKSFVKRQMEEGRNENSLYAPNTQIKVVEITYIQSIDNIQLNGRLKIPVKRCKTALEGEGSPCLLYKQQRLFGAKICLNLCPQTVSVPRSEFFFLRAKLEESCERYVQSHFFKIGYCHFIIHQIFFAKRAVQIIGEYHFDVPQC